MFNNLDLEKYIYYRRPDFDKIVKENGLTCSVNEFMKYWKVLDDNRKDLWNILRGEIKYSLRFEPLTEKEIQALQIMGVNKYLDNTFKIEAPKEIEATTEQIYSIEEFESKKTTQLSTIQDMTSDIISIKDDPLVLQMQKEAVNFGCRLAIIGEFYGNNYYINIKDPEGSINSITGDHGDAIIMHMTIEYFRNK